MRHVLHIGCCLLSLALSACGGEILGVGKEGKPQPITTMISQETLAEIIGTTRPRVSYFMNKFRKLGFIDYNGHLEVHSSLLTVLLAD